MTEQSLSLSNSAVPALLRAGAQIPRLGLGTWDLRGQACTDIVCAALGMGYTHIDTAQSYDNEVAVGVGISEAGVKRESVFVTTKVQPTKMGDGDLQRSIDESLRNLNLDKIDLVLLHWPNPAIPLADSIRALNEVKRRGLVAHIGLSNFPTAMLADAWRLTTEPFAAEQIEYHPYLDQTKMLDALREAGMATIAYSPIAMGKVVGDPAIEAIAATHRRKSTQVTLRWLLQQDGVVVIPKTSRIDRLRDNLAVFDFDLSDEEMARIGSLTDRRLRLVHRTDLLTEWD